jgi:signal peptidase I
MIQLQNPGTFKEARLDFLHSEPIPDPSTTPSNRLRRSLLEFIETLLMAALLFAMINLLTARIRVMSISMEPNLHEGNLVIVNKVAYHLVGEPQRGDVIVFENPINAQDDPYIKRVIGLPGDSVRIENGQVFVNGSLLSEPYLTVSTIRGGEFRVPEQSLFVMGDNRNNSSDSRQWGMVPYEEIIGRAEVIYWPPENWQFLHVFLAEAAQP